jgi:toxin ParE1/3/4
MKVRYRERAFADLEEIHRFLEPHSPIGARNVLEAIRDAVDEIARTPFGSRRTSDPDIRVKVLGRYRYKIFYSVSGDTVEIVHIRHAVRRPWKG